MNKCCSSFLFPLKETEMENNGDYCTGIYLSCPECYRLFFRIIYIENYENSFRNMFKLLTV